MLKAKKYLILYIQVRHTYLEFQHLSLFFQNHQVLCRTLLSRVTGFTQARETDTEIVSHSNKTYVYGRNGFAGNTYSQIPFRSNVFYVCNVLLGNTSQPKPPRTLMREEAISIESSA